MAVNSKKPAFRVLFLIATPKLTGKAEELLKEGSVHMQYRFHAQGTASSEILDILGLGGIEKNVLMCMMPKIFADEMLRKLKKKLYLGMPGTGIAFTIPMLGGSGRVFKLMQSMLPEESEAIGESLWRLNERLEKVEQVNQDGYQLEEMEQRKIQLEKSGYRKSKSERNEDNMADNEYSMIMVIVDQGYSEDVMNAARPMGASGGTVFHSRRIGNEETMKFWGISVQQERETVLILAKKDEKMSIMKAIGEKCGMHSEAHGIVLSLPVDGVVGMD